jgi:DNA-binding transcriptional ArsR family regulator
MVDARLFQALSDPTRLDILGLLARGTINVSRIVTHLGCAQPAVSRHLRVLREAGLISDRRKGKEVEYSLNLPQLARAAAYLGDLAASEAAREGHAAQGGAAARPAHGTAGGTAAGGARAAGRRPRSIAGGRRAFAPAGRAPKQAARTRPSVEPEPTPPAQASPRARDFTSGESAFVVIPKKKSDMDDFLL